MKNNHFRFKNKHYIAIYDKDFGVYLYYEYIEKTKTKIIMDIDEMFKLDDYFIRLRKLEDILEK